MCVGSEVKVATFVRSDRCESPFNFKLHPRLLFFPFITHLLLCLSCVFLLPTASLVHSQHTPQRGRLMRANDRKACCCFPFINRCTLAHWTLFIRRLLSARALLFPSSITSLPRLLSFTFFIAHTGQLLSSFSICTYLFCLLLVFCSPPQPLLRPLLRTLTCVNVALMTAQWHFSGQTESLLMKQKHLSPHRLMTLQRLATNKSVWTLLNPDSFCSLQKNMYVSYTVSSCGLFVFVYQWRSFFFLF